MKLRNSYKVVLWLVLAGMVVLSGIHCGGEYQPPQGTATAGTATVLQSFAAEPQVGIPLDALKQGDRVWAMKTDGCYYPAHITKLINERYYVRYADGERGRLKLEKLSQWRLSPGMAAEVMQSEGKWERAVISALAGENVAVQIGNSSNLKVVALTALRIRSFPPS
jgi:hypothetical protein